MYYIMFFYKYLPLQLSFFLIQYEKVERRFSMKKAIEKKKSNRLTKTQTYILYFFLFAFLGWCMETIYGFIVLGHFTKRGFLYGPLCPIYGYGALILIIFLGKYRNQSFKLFVYSTIIFSVFEYLASYVLEVLFHSYWWDYTNDFFNLNGRISIFYSLAWGIIAIIFVGHLYPFFKKKVNLVLSKIPYKIKIFLLHSVCIIFIGDTILSCIRYLNV